MDIAVALVQAYLRVNGYFTVAEYPVIEAVQRGKYRTVTDLDILAFRFPNAGRLVPGAEEGQAPFFEPDPLLGVSRKEADLIIGEVKEGRAELNHGAQDPNVMRVALRRFGCCGASEVSVVDQLIRTGEAKLSSGYRVRLVAFGTSQSDQESPGFQVILLHQVMDFLQNYVKQHWKILKHGQFKDPALGFLLTLEKIRRSTL